jgi:hypothetical protein
MYLSVLLHRSLLIEISLFLRNFEAHVMYIPFNFDFISSLKSIRRPVGGLYLDLFHLMQLPYQLNKYFNNFTRCPPHPIRVGGLSSRTLTLLLSSLQAMHSCSTGDSNTFVFSCSVNVILFNRVV